VLEYDSVVNKQREVIYAQRRQVLGASDLRDQVERMVGEEIAGVVAAHTPGPDAEDWDLRGLQSELRAFLPLPSGFSPRQWRERSRDEIEDELDEMAEQAYDGVNRAFGHQVYRQAVQEDLSLQSLANSADPARRMAYMRTVDRLGAPPDEDVAGQPLRRLPAGIGDEVEAAFVDAYRLFRDRHLMLQAVDGLWVRHLTDLEALREGIGLRAYGQHNPLVAYRKEAHEMYEALLARIQETVARSVYLVPQAQVASPRRRRLQARHTEVSRGTQRTSQKRAKAESGPGRNEPCWCGSGKKYKQCHMREDAAAQRSQPVAAKPPQASRRKRRR
jgi:preprotein translocase subunit SecA